MAVEFVWLKDHFVVANTTFFKHIADNFLKPNFAYNGMAPNWACR